MSLQKKQRVGIFARALTQGGVKRFLQNILTELDADTSREYFLFTDDPAFGESFHNITTIHVQSRHKLLWDYWASLLAGRRYKLDVATYTKNIVPVTHLWLRARRVIFVYDLGYFEKQIQAYAFLDTLYMRLFFGLSVRLAHVILAISQATKDDLVRILGADPNKVRVMYLAAESTYQPCNDPARVAAICKKYQLTQPFLFYCGNLSPRKNIPRIVEAFATLQKSIPHHLYLAGPKKLGNEDVLRHAEQMFGDRFRHLGFIDEEDLPLLYAAADLYLFPSLYEGFGLPILEANACGCPVLTSNLTSCPEIAGGAAHIVDAYSSESIAQGITAVVTNRTYRAELVEKGKHNAKTYDWKKTAQVVRDNL